MRKVTALVLAGALTFGTALPAAARGGPPDFVKAKQAAKFEDRFRDWESLHWANESMARMVVKGVIQGNSDGTIAAARPVSRLEAAIMLSRLLGLQEPVMPYGEFRLSATWGEIKIENKQNDFEIKMTARGQGEFKFEDSGMVPDWGRGAVLTALREGFLIFDGARLNPNAPLNRLEAAIMLVKAAGLDAEAKSRAGAQLSFTDANRIPDRLQGYIAVAVEHGFVNGYEDGTFKPTRTLTRAEWAALLDRLDRQGDAVSADGRQVKGTVTGVSVGAAPAITMTTPVFPDGVTYAVDDTAVFYKDGKPVTIADVGAGDNVIVNLSADRKVLMVTVSNVASTLSGHVTAYTAPVAATPGSITVQGAAGTVARTYAVSAQTAVYVGTQLATATDVRVGDRVDLSLVGSTLTKVTVKVEAATVTGTLYSITLGSAGTLPVLTVTGSTGTVSTYQVADHATISASGGGALSLADLHAGDQVTLRTERNQVVSIVRTQAAQATTISGMIASITAPGTANGTYSIALLTDGVVTTYTLAADAVLKVGDTTVTAGNLRLGDQVLVNQSSGTILLLLVTSRNS